MTAKPIEVEADSPLEDYLYEVGILAEFVLSKGGSSRDREMIRQQVEHHIIGQQKEARKRDKKFQPLPTNRLQQVVRGLAIGVTKVLEAWEYVALNKAWPPDA